MNIPFKKKSKNEEVKVDFKDQKTLDDLYAKKQAILKSINELDPEDDDYDEKYGKKMGLFKSIQDSLKQESIHEGIKIENANKAAETELKKKESNSKVKAAMVTGGFALGGCILIPIMDNLLGPAMSKVMPVALGALFKK